MKKYLGMFLIALLIITVLSLTVIISCKIAIQTTVNSMGNGILDDINHTKKEVDRAVEKLNKYIDPENETNRTIDSIINDYKKIKSYIRRRSDYGARIEGLAKLTNKEVEQETSAIIANSLKFCHPLNFSLSWITQESYCHKSVVGSSGELGLTQIMPSTWEKCGGRRFGSFYNWKDTLNFGFWYMEGRLKLAKGNEKLALIYYNGGEKIFKCKRESINKARLHASRTLLIKKQIIKEFEG